MAHFAEIDQNNIVTRVIVVDNALEPMGSQWCNKIFGGTWIQTSYNGKIRKNYASVGYSYDKELDAFIPPKPHDSWILNMNTCQWESPIPSPNDGNLYFWDENLKSWIKPPTE